MLPCKFPGLNGRIMHSSSSFYERIKKLMKTGKGPRVPRVDRVDLAAHAMEPIDERPDLAAVVFVGRRHLFNSVSQKSAPP